MAATNARSGFGTLLQREDSPGSGTYTTVAEVTNIGGPSETLDTDDATHMESPDGFGEIIPTLAHGGTVDLTLNLVEADTTQLNMHADLQSKTKRNYRMIWPAQSKEALFAAYVTEHNPAQPVDGKMVRNCTLTLTGKVTIQDSTGP